MSVYSVNQVNFDGEERLIDFGICVIAAGPHSGELAKLAGIGKGIGGLQFPLPVQPRYVLNVSEEKSKILTLIKMVAMVFSWTKGENLLFD